MDFKKKNVLTDLHKLSKELFADKYSLECSLIQTTKTLKQTNNSHFGGGAGPPALRCRETPLLRAVEIAGYSDRVAARQCLGYEQKYLTRYLRLKN